MPFRWLSGLILLVAACTPQKIISPPAVPVLQPAWTDAHPNRSAIWSAISPDGRQIATSATGSELYIRELTTGAEAVQHGFADNTSTAFAHAFVGPHAFAWAADSSGVFIVRGPGRRPLVTPALMRLDGTIEDLPVPRHPGGPLDGLFYIGGDGLAFARFGTDGQFRGRDPARETRSFGFVNVRTGAVLDTVSYRDAFGDGADDASFFGGSGTVLPDGRLRMAGFGAAHTSGAPRFFWLVWTQGSAPKVLREFRESEIEDMAISPGGIGLLVTRRVVADSPCRSSHPHPSDPCLRRPIRPNTGVIASFHDSTDGRTLWEIEATAYGGYGWSEPSFSPDGRFAVIGWPSSVDGRSGRPLLIRLADGVPIWRLTAPSPHYRTSFSPLGDALWLDSADQVSRFDLAEATRSSAIRTAPTPRAETVDVP